MPKIPPPHTYVASSLPPSFPILSAPLLEILRFAKTKGFSSFNTVHCLVLLSYIPDKCHYLVHVLLPLTYFTEHKILPFHPSQDVIIKWCLFKKKMGGSRNHDSFIQPSVIEFSGLLPQLGYYTW